ncbi:alpha/beta hydrolase [Rhodococcus sp. (in: high G+C Gram-positive bacteria)]|jgi:pimeloyl-ACP methyl ester carboxylesterase|uniref:alpha/beta hydrolase n=1 Tax=unclassified Rhodococcus (in: high G+C Gram-positive bacteria) TaxID=192944 RepID=UPI0019E45186|nr:alpha/beta hydrolase [Rhodococcus sp. (in: high G+C Gram-positive bacteria)]MBF0660116.1 alpha/beta hydrolase [Rhodococcus sp. (in: high G+C Gram-positive bacteria)]
MNPTTGPEPRDHFQRIPYEPATDGRVEMHSGLSRHYPTLHGNLVAAPGYSREVGVIMCHPASNFLSHFLLRAFAGAGIPAMGLNTRYASNEPALIMERAAFDLGTGVRWMTDELGFEKVVLLGFSGGGSLASFYQSQAENPTVTQTPAGDPARFADAKLRPADGLLLVGAHPGRARVLRHWIDGAVVDEADPYATDPDLDLYAPGRTVPLDREWVARYRDAQLARMRRIDAWALGQLDELNRMGASDRGFVVHRTVGDPRFVDTTLDPSDREAGSMYGDPAAANTAAGGLARFVTVRSWLSTWSVDHTHADALTDLSNVTAPALVMSLLGDQAAFAEDSRLMRDALPGEAELIEMRNLNHYLVDQPGGLDDVVSRLTGWIRRTVTDDRAEEASA